MPALDKFDPLQAYRLRRLMNRVEISTRPQRHAGLGTEAYLTLTSPIRRFYDLLMEVQILRAIRGEAVFKEEELQEIITRVSPVLSRVNLVEELTERYWIYRFLEKKIGATFTAVVLDRLANKYLVHINDFLLEVEMPLVPGREFVPGDEILVWIEKAQARSGVLKISPL
jgi:exoribonuclease-2